MTAPTIPELVARLRELVETATPARWQTVTADDPRGMPSPMYRGLVAHISSTLAIVTEDDSATEADEWPANAELIVELRNALPVILDALERGQVPAHVVAWSGTFRGTEADPRECGWCETCGREVYDGDGQGHHSPDAGKKVEPSGDSGGSLTIACTIAGSRYCRYEDAVELDAARRRAAQAMRQLAHERRVLAERLAALESRSAWRPITRVPTAEEHAWCRGRYLFESDDGSGFAMTVNFGDPAERAEFFGALTCERYMLIPPSDHSGDVNEMGDAGKDGEPTWEAACVAAIEAMDRAWDEAGDLETKEDVDSFLALLNELLPERGDYNPRKFA